MYMLFAISVINTIPTAMLLYVVCSVSFKSPYTIRKNLVFILKPLILNASLLYCISLLNVTYTDKISRKVFKISIVKPTNFFIFFKFDTIFGFKEINI